MTASHAAGEARVGALLCVAIYLSLSGVSAISHDYWRDGRRVESRAAVYDAVVAGQAKAPGQYRVLIPFLTEGLRALGVPFRAAAVSLRLLFTFASALLLHGLLRRWFRPEVCLIGTLLWFACLPITHLIYQMSYTDPANFAFTLGALWLIAERRDGGFALLLAISMLNRETMLLLPLVWLFYRWDELPPLRCSAAFAGYCAIVFGVYFALRAHYGAIPHAGVEYFQRLGKSPLAQNLTMGPALAYFLSWFAVPIYLAVRGFADKPKFMRRALLFVPFFVLFHLWVALVFEPRLMLPVFPMVLAPALASIASPRPEATPETRTWPWLLRSPRWVYISALLAFVVATHALGYRLTHSALPFASNEIIR